MTVETIALETFDNSLHVEKMVQWYVKLIIFMTGIEQFWYMCTQTFIYRKILVYFTDVVLIEKVVCYVALHPSN